MGLFSYVESYIASAMVSGMIVALRDPGQVLDQRRVSLSLDNSFMILSCKWTDFG